ncbi:cytochrome P450 81E8-like [Quercus robur]|uniref:cytochrome P450 81E8-like n=1 Tax=Quercus robur TaxID=38942 RepID=UPI002163BC01|nr:cytochrome P450 81E8-like [Quercus robur]
MGDFLPIIKWVGLSGLEKRLVILQGKRDKFMQDLIEELRRTRDSSDFEGKTKTMTDVLLSLQEAEPEYYTDEIIRGMMLVMLSAGTDTSSGTIEWAMSLLLNNPEAIAKAQAKIDKHIGQSKLIEESDLADLPYLCGIIMRHFGCTQLAHYYQPTSPQRIALWEASVSHVARCYW